jgi:uncharacterized membrane protein YdjX (TVP38/TMEM64 family)
MAEASRRLQFKIALAGVGVAGLALFFLGGGEHWLSLEFLKENRDRLAAWTDRHYGLMLLASGAVYVVATALSLPVGAVLSLGLGFLFGRWVGTGVTVLAATVGATLAFWAARFVFADAARARLSAYPAAARLLEGFRQDAFRYLLFLRLVPLFPFWLVNLVPAFTVIDTRTYVLATLIGVVPGSFVYVNLGRTLGQIDSLGELWSPEVVLGFALLGVLVLLPGWLKDPKAGV